VDRGPTKKLGEVRRPVKHASPKKRLYAGKATTPIGLASSLDRNYRRCVACERAGGAVFTGPGAPRCHEHGVLREDIDGEREELQKELDLVRRSTVRYL
jgi:hypothetical protein